MNSKQLWARRRELANKVNELINANEIDEARRVEGQLREIDEEITRKTEEEAAAREAQAAQAIATKHSLAQHLFGDRGAFSGIKPGFEAKAPVRDAIEGLPTPQIYRRDLKGPIAPPTGFLATIAHGTTDGDEHFFLTPVLTNKAAGWVSGKKPESALKWEEATAPIETIAHWIPILKQTARRYSQLESIVSNSLMLGLDLKCDELVLRGTNASGITGVCETTGILTHKKVEGKNLKDTFAAMKRKVRVATGVAPNYVCLSPYALEELSEEKDQVGRYLFPDIGNGGSIAGLTCVEDVNMTTEEKETALVYYNYGASFDIADPEEVTIGLVDSQFIENAYTILAELTAALRVDMPGAFCYCDDLGLEVEGEVTKLTKVARADMSVSVAKKG